MTHQQALAFGLVIVTIGLFVWGRFRYDLVSLVALLASVALGVTPVKKAFDGFSSDVVVIIAPPGSRAALSMRCSGMWPHSPPRWNDRLASAPPERHFVTPPMNRSQDNPVTLGVRR